MVKQIPPGYSWKGKVEDHSLGALYNRSAELRFTGRLTLAEPGRTVTVSFVGGETIESLGQQVLAEGGYKRGTFEMTQAVTGLDGELTDDVELAGSLGATKVRDLIGSAAEGRLTADLHLDGGAAGAARIRFTHGRIESVELGGKADLSALRKVEQWSSGSFRLALRPLFTSGAPVAAAPLPQAKMLGEQSFDLTGGAMNVGLRRQDLDTTPAKGSSLPPARPIDQARSSVPPRPAPEPAPEPAEDPMPSENTDRTRRSPNPPEGMRPAPRSSGSRIWIIVLAALAAAAVLGGLAWLLLRAPAAPSLPPPAPKVVAPAPPAPAPPPPAVEKPAAPRMHPKAVEACALLVTGHARSARDLAVGALRKSPDDEHLGAMLEMAKGKTGKGKLSLEGAGEVSVCGESLVAPRQLKLPAGPYLVESGGVAEIVELAKGKTTSYRRR